VIVSQREITPAPRSRKTHRKGPRGIARSGPAPTAVQVEALVTDNLEDTTALEGLWVCLTLDLQHVEGEEDNLSNTDKAASGRVHDSLARLFAERALKVLAVVLPQVVARDGLTAIFVDTLENLVASGIPQTGEKRKELARSGCVCLVLEDDLVQLRCARHLGLVAHEALRDSVDGMEDSQLSNTSGT